MTPKRNYQIEMERVLSALSDRADRPRLLLHACCAPCSSAVLESLTAHFDISVLFYNPNISPESEYLYRREELARLIGELPHTNRIELIRPEYDPERFYAMARGLETAPEGGERCTRCFRLRLERSAREARDGGFEFFTTTLSISPLKDAQRLNAIGGELATLYGVPYLFSDFKKKNGYRRSCVLSREYGLYRQDYCGCSFSRAERERRKREHAAEAARTPETDPS